MGCSPEILGFPGEEHEVLDTRLDEVLAYFIGMVLELLEPGTW